jgi:uncharacterized protein (TIGR02996 family)
LASDAPTLLAAVAANLNEDVPRLEYADWLDETADEIVGPTPEKILMKDRAEFIRIQISLASKSDVGGGRPWTPELAGQLTARANALLTLHRDAWEARIRQALPHSCIDVTFHHGFPRHVTVNGPHELVTSRILESDTNTLTGLRVTNLGHNLPELLAHQGIAKLTTLDLSGNHIWDEGAEAIADSLHLARLTSLNLSNNGLRSAAVITLANSLHLKNLTELNLADNSIRPAGAIALAASPNFAKLITLNLWNNIIGNEGAEALANSPHLTKLTSLNFAHNNIGVAGAEALAAGTLPLTAKLTALRSVGFDALADHVEERAALVLRQFHGY